MNSLEFLDVIKESFITCLKTSERSTAKLNVLHGSIAMDIYKRLGSHDFSIMSKGIGDGKEGKIAGRYYDKAVDIIIKKSGVPIAGVAVKFVMSNYSQNSNNYFENMLGETANIRCAGIPYFQVFVIPEELPYFEKGGDLSRWEHISEHHVFKYLNVSRDSVDTSMHTPNKTLFFMVNIDKEQKGRINSKTAFKDYYINNEFNVTLSNTKFNFGDAIIYNNYEKFADEICKIMKA